MASGLVIFVFAILTASATPGAVAHADTTADCGRFFLKYDKATGRMKCVSGKRKKPKRSDGVREIRRQQRTVQRILTQVQETLSIQDLGDAERRRVGELITEARQRIQQIRRRTAQLRQEQISFTQEVQSAARQRTQAQAELSRSLEQQQRELVQQLEARQRQLAQSQQRRSRNARR